ATPAATSSAPPPALIAVAARFALPLGCAVAAEGVRLRLVALAAVFDRRFGVFGAVAMFDRHGTGLGAAFALETVLIASSAAAASASPPSALAVAAIEASAALRTLAMLVVLLRRLGCDLDYVFAGGFLVVLRFVDLFEGFFDFLFLHNRRGIDRQSCDRLSL